MAQVNNFTNTTFIAPSALNHVELTFERMAIDHLGVCGHVLITAYSKPYDNAGYHCADQYAMVLPYMDADVYWQALQQLDSVVVDLFISNASHTELDVEG